MLPRRSHHRGRIATLLTLGATRYRMAIEVCLGLLLAPKGKATVPA